jgi:hypothetical protein
MNEYLGERKPKAKTKNDKNNTNPTVPSRREASNREKFPLTTQAPKKAIARNMKKLGRKADKNLKIASMSSSVIRSEGDFSIKNPDQSLSLRECDPVVNGKFFR